MIFFPSKNRNELNGLPFDPEEITGTAMVNPHYPSVSLAHGTEALIDSGAFQARDLRRRLHPAEALARQTAFASRLAAGARGLKLRLVTYDMLQGVDEALTADGERVKRRGDERTAGQAVTQTMWSASYYAAQRVRLRSAGIGLCFAAQGATLPQYLRCTRALLDVMEPGEDWFAFGGFCIIGMQPSLKPQFVETVRQVLPLLAARGVRRAHILGVCVHDALMAAAALGRAHGVTLSTDSSSIEVNSVHGKVWDAAHMATSPKGGPWRKVWGKEAKRAPGGYHPCTLALENIRRFAAWSGGLAGADAAPRVPIPAYVPPPAPVRLTCPWCFWSTSAPGPCARCGTARVVTPAEAAAMEDCPPPVRSLAARPAAQPAQMGLFPADARRAAA